MVPRTHGPNGKKIVIRTHNPMRCAHWLHYRNVGLESNPFSPMGVDVGGFKKSVFLHVIAMGGCFLWGMTAIPALCWGSAWAYNNPMLVYDHEAAPTWIEAQCYVINRPKYKEGDKTDQCDADDTESSKCRYKVCNIARKFGPPCSLM